MRIIISAIVAGLALAGAPAAFCEDAAGQWLGVLSLPAPTGATHVGLRLKRAADGSWSGSWNNMDQGGRNLPVADVKADGQTVSLSVPVRSSHFEGKWDPAKMAWVGTWSAGQISVPLELTRGVIPPAPVVQGLDGDWDGTIEANAVHVRVAWHVRTTAEDGTYASFDSVDQGVNNIPVSGISRDGANVKLELKIAGAAFQGVLSADGATIAGQWSQNGYMLPLTLTRRPAAG